MSVWLVRISLIHLAVGSTLGALLLAAKAGVPAGVPAALLVVHREVVLFGWIVQFVLGVGFWILPPARATWVSGRAWWVVGMLNGGVALSAVSMAAGFPDPVSQTVNLVGRILEAGAIFLFVAPVARRGFR